MAVVELAAVATAVVEIAVVDIKLGPLVSPPPPGKGSVRLSAVFI